MADKDLETEKLELSLFRRKRKKDRQPASDEPPTASGPADEPAEEPSQEPAQEPVRSAAGSAAPPADRSTDTLGDDSEPATPTTVMPPRQEEPRAAVHTERPRGGGARVAPKPPRQVQLPQLPALAGGVASLVVGAVVGLAAVALTFASLRLCELVTGTDSCGGPGLVVLLVVVVLMILGGAAALRMFDVPDAGGLSFLGVAMFVAVCLVVLLPNLLEPWMIVVAPVLCALTFLLAHWIVTRFDEEILEQEQPEPHDVR